MRILILIFLLALSITANTECEVNGYYRANGTWVNGYTKSGDCWNDKVIGYDAQGRTADERQQIRVEKNRILIPIALATLFLLLFLLKKVEEDGVFGWIFGWGSFLLGGYIVYGIIQDPILLIITILIIFIWYKFFRKQKKQKSIVISDTDENDTLNRSTVEKFNALYGYTDYEDKEASNIATQIENQKEKNILNEITYNSKQIVESCNTIYVISELHRVLKKIHWMDQSHNLLQEVYEQGYAIQNHNTGGLCWTEKGKKYLVSLINFGIVLPNDLNEEFIEAKYDLENYDSEYPLISRDLARELYKSNSRKLIYNDESYSVFTFAEYGVILNKYDNEADKCYLQSKGATTMVANKDELLQFFYGGDYSDDDYDKPDYEDDEYGTVNGKVYLADGVWIDRKDVWW